MNVSLHLIRGFASAHLWLVFYFAIHSLSLKVMNYQTWGMWSLRKIICTFVQSRFLGLLTVNTWVYSINSKKFTKPILNSFQNCWEVSGISFQKKSIKTKLQNQPDGKTAAATSAAINTNNICQLPMPPGPMPLSYQKLNIIR